METDTTEKPRTTYSLRRISSADLLALGFRWYVSHQHQPTGLWFGEEESPHFRTWGDARGYVRQRQGGS